jgi:hypothetical protein
MVREAIGDGTVVPVVGADVSAATAGLPSWSQLVGSAVDHVERHRSAEASDIEEGRKQLAERRLVAAAESGRKLLGAPDAAYRAGQIDDTVDQVGGADLRAAPLELFDQPAGNSPL